MWWLVIHENIRFGAGYLSGVIFQKGKYIPVPSKDSNYDDIKEQIREHIKTKSIFVYPEMVKKRTDIYELCEFRTGIFNIAKELNIPVVPVVIDHIKYGIGGIIPSRRPCQIHIGRPYTINDDDNTINIIREWMSTRLRSMNLTKSILM